MCARARRALGTWRFSGSPQRPSQLDVIIASYRGVVVCKLAPDHPPPEGEERPKKEADRSRLVGSSVSKQGNLSMRLVFWEWGAGSTRQEISASARQNLQSSHGGLNEAHSHILSRWVQPHHTLSGCGNGGRDRQSKDRRGGQEPVIAWVQLKHQLVITSSR